MTFKNYFAFGAIFFCASAFFFSSTLKVEAAYPFGDEVVLYHFEDTATGTTTDGITGTTTNSGTGGTAYDGILVGNASTSATQARFGSRSGSFGEVTDLMRTRFGSSTNPTTQSISVSLWAYKGSNNCTSDDDHIFGVSGSPTNNRFYIRCKVSTTNKWGYRIQGGTEVFSTASVSTTSWDHIVLVANATTDAASYYVNGTAIGSAVAYTTYTLPGDFYVGNFNDVIGLSTNQGAGAFIDEVAIYNRALTAGEVTEIYQAGQPPSQVSALAATPYEGRVYLTWTAGSGTTTDYYVEYKLSADSTWTTFSHASSTATNIVVTGLVNGSSYDFRVTPRNLDVFGTVSSTVTTVPLYRIAFVTPTPTPSSTITASSFTASASTTLPTASIASSTQKLRLETAGGSLVSEVSTTTRYGNYNLTHLTNTLPNSDLSILDNSSGIAYVSTTDSLFIVHNRAIGADSTIDEVDKNGTLIRALTCTGCGDIEGITLISSVASSTVGGYDHTFMISTENDLSSAEIFRVLIHSTGTTPVNRLDYFNTGITHNSNGGLEGIAYNPSNGKFYVARELTTPALYEVTLPASGRTATSNQICGNLTWNAAVSDFSDLAFNNNILYVLSENTNPSKLVAVNVTSTSTCAYVDSDGDGDVSNSDTGDWLTSLAVGGTDQAEGVTWDATGDTLYVLGEADFLAKYRATVFTSQNTFSGVSNGNYVLKSSFLDTNGVTSSSTDREFTVNFDITAPIISAIATSTTQTTATITWTTNEAASSTVNYGSTMSYGTASSSQSLVTSHLITLTGLSAGTLYHFNVGGSDAASNTSTSSDLTFTTDALSVSIPTLSVQAASSVSTSTATLNGTITSNNNASSTIRGFNYGLSTSYGSVASTTGTFGTGAFSQAVSGLTPGTLYHFQAFAVNSAGMGTSSDQTFTTDTVPDVGAPIISSISAGTPDSSSATITWTTDELASSRVQFGVTTSYSSSTLTVDTSPRVLSHSISLPGLRSCTNYEYRVISTDASSNTATSSNSSFTTTGCVGSADIEDDNATAVTTSGGGSASLVTGSRTLALAIPSGFAASDATFQIKKIDGADVMTFTGGVSGSSSLANLVYDLQAYQDEDTTITTFLNPIVLTFTYTDADVSGVLESSLRIFRYNGSVWSPLSNCSVNTAANTVSCETSNFSTFGVFGTTIDTPVAAETTSSRSSRRGGARRIVAEASATVAAPSPAKYVFTRDLKAGDTGADVKELQKFLNTSGFTVSLAGPGSMNNETELFGPATVAALTNFQNAHKAEVLTPSGLSSGTGFFGSATRNYVNNSTLAAVGTSSVAPTTAPVVPTTVRNLALGDIGEDVKALQIFLNNQGFAVAATGPGSKNNETTKFGPATEAALKRFQEQYRAEILTPNGFTKATGIVGPSTRSVMKNLQP